MDPREVTFILLIGPKERDLDRATQRKSVLLSALDCKNFTEHQERPFRGGVSEGLPTNHLLPTKLSDCDFKVDFFCLLTTTRHKNSVLLFIWFCSPQLHILSIKQLSMTKSLGNPSYRQASKNIWDFGQVHSEIQRCLQWKQLHVFTLHFLCK